MHDHLDKETVTAGNPIVASWTVTGGTAPYTYAYEWNITEKNGGGVYHYGETTSSELSLTPLYGVSGYLQVYVTDALECSKFFYSETFAIIGAPDPLVCEIDLNKEVVSIGEEINASWTVTGGYAPYDFEYRWVIIDANGDDHGEYGGGTTAQSNYVPREGSRGFFEVIVTDASGWYSQDFQSADFAIASEVPIDPLDCTIRFDKNPVAVGNPIVASWTVTGGTAPYTYEYEWIISEDNGEETSEYSVGTLPESSYTPYLGVRGNLWVKVIDSNGYSKGFTSDDFTIIGAISVDPLDCTIELSKNIVIIGEQITATWTVTSGTAPYSYEYEWDIDFRGYANGEGTLAKSSFSPDEGDRGFLLLYVTDALGREKLFYSDIFKIMAVPDPLTCTITFDSKGRSAVGAITQAYDTAVTAPANPTRTGYSFVGWLPAVPAKMPSKNITCVAQWKANQYKITFDAKGGSAVNTIAQAYDTAVTAPAKPTKTGYTFAGWSPAVPPKMPAENITCVAQWTVNQYKITFDSKGGSTVKTITQAYNTTVTAPANPTKKGYIFGGWVPAVPTKMPAESITCVAQWKAILSSITAPNVVVGVGQTAKIAYELQPSGATAKSIAFTSKDKKIATIDANGNIKGIKAGSTTITIVADQSVKCTIKVTVKKAPTSVSIKAGKTTLGVGEKTTTSVTLSSGSAGSWTYSTSNAGVAKVDANGTITATGAGSATITVKTYNGKKTTVKITVLAAPTGVTLNADTLTLGMGASTTLTATLSKNSTGAYTFSSGNTKVATVDAKGVVKALSKGTAVITVGTYNGKKDTCTVTVVDAPTKVILTAGRTTIGIGEKIQLGGEVQPKTASGTPAFSSSKTSVATVSATGLVTAKKAGTATITATMYNGVKTTVKITVKKAPTSVSIKAGKTTLGVGEKTTTAVTLSSGSAGSWAYATSNAGVATVDASGAISAIGAGTATITVRTYNGKSATVKITVK